MPKLPTRGDYAIVRGRKCSIDAAGQIALDRIMRQLGFMTDQDVRVGYIGDVERKKEDASTLEDKRASGSRAVAMPRRAPTINNATLAYIHEHGDPSRNLPARPFLRPVMEQERAFVETTLSKAMREALTHFDAKSIPVALRRIGLQLSTRAKENIRTQHNMAPLSKRTLARKGSKTKALIDTGQLLNAITYEVGKR